MLVDLRDKHNLKQEEGDKFKNKSKNTSSTGRWPLSFAYKKHEIKHDQQELNSLLNSVDTIKSYYIEESVFCRE